ncbi:flagellar hook-basal body protein [Alkalihalobacillus sp. BA299]|uniref:flagellar hook-basal body protein n=1 Tax=Alkalihalobacillus sp. BA299 TaxID=2815938 RepID=UPI001ADAC70F|nr:flagellar hook-basal body protein [Alkalihalobacillus sp. BA299]
MNTSMMTASVTMGQLQKKMDTIAHNMANTNTTGFKRREATFSDLLFQQVNNQTVPSMETGRLTPNGIRVGAGAKIGQTSLRTEQGSIQQTDRPLDLAIQNPSHFFQVEVSNNGESEVRYTRDGAFYFSQNPNNPDVLNVVTGQGHQLLGPNGPITVPADHSEVQIDENGRISVILRDGTTAPAGQVELVRVQRPQILEQIGENLFGLPDNLIEQGYVPADILGVIGAEQASLKQGALEMSNVDIGKEMSEMLLAQRSYQFNARSISTADQMMGLVNSIR